MIRVYKQKAPDYIESNEILLAVERMTTFYSETERRQKRYSWPFKKEIDKKIVKYLEHEFHGKCGYCERKIERSSFSNVDRYRPHNGVRDENEYFEDLYWWTAYDWENLIYSCKECSQYKANYFPVKKGRVSTKGISFEEEVTLLIHPCTGNPSLYFSYDNEGNIHSSKEEGVQTLELLRLNRTDLVESRQKAKKEIDSIIKELTKEGKHSFALDKVEYLRSISNNEDPSIEFLSFKKWILLNEISSNSKLGHFFQIKEEFRKVDKSNTDYDGDDFLKSDYFPIEYIEIENFKSISKLRIDFKEDDIDQKSWLFLLGENGVGKSSILQAIALGFKNNLKGDDISTFNLIQKKKQKAIIRIKERNSDNVLETVLTRKDRKISQKGVFDSFLLGYGSLRLSSSEVPIKSKRDFNKVTYVNLFNPVLPLNDITAWLKSIYKKDRVLFDRVAYTIKELLPHDYIDNELTIERGKITFKNSEVLFSELSDGFKSTIVLAVDIMMKLSSANSDFDKVSGIVIIDELGNQLHPRWQMRIVSQLRVVFPNINFIVSTHHPLCLRGAEKNEIFLLKSLNQEVVAITELPDPSSMRVDQILASEFFGLSSMIDPLLEAKFNRYYELLAKQNDLVNSEKTELSKLKDELRNKKQLGTTLREELMYYAIDKLLATKVSYNDEGVKREELKDEVIQRVSNIWKNLKLD